MSEQIEKRCIKCSTDYDQFQSSVEQRLLRPGLVTKITTSMKKYGFIPTAPIVVDKQNRILDGQHRFQSAKNLGIAFYYVISDHLPIDAVREMAKAQDKWSLEDYVTSNIHQGNADYARLRELKELSGLSWSAFMYGVFSDSAQKRDDIYMGRFNLTEQRESEILEFLGKFDIFKDKFAAWSHRGFVIACAVIFSHKDYSHEQMKSRLEYQQNRLVRCANAEGYVKMLETIYNYKSHAHNVVDFSKARRQITK